MALENALRIPTIIMDVFRLATTALKADQKLVQRIAYDIYEHAPNGNPDADHQESEITIEYYCGQVFLGLLSSGSAITQEALVEQTQQALTNFFVN